MDSKIKIQSFLPPVQLQQKLQNAEKSVKTDENNENCEHELKMHVWLPARNDCEKQSIFLCENIKHTYQLNRNIK